MGIVAAFDKVIYFNPNSKYTVMRVKTADLMIPNGAKSPFKYADHLIRFTAVGYDLPQSTALSMDLEGKWVDGKYGLQLQVDRWGEVIPPTIEGIRAYLASGLLKGISLLEGIKGIATVRFTSDDIVRHHLVTKIVKAFDSAQ